MIMVLPATQVAYPVAFYTHYMRFHATQVQGNFGVIPFNSHRK
jgi:hypothetical protein